LTLLRNLRISGFRRFREFRVDGLARVNLFVGSNQTGKTTMLEAAELVAMGTASGLLRGPRRRRESTWVKEEATSSARRSLDLSHLFHGHALKVGATFEISSGSSSWVRCEVTEGEPYPATIVHAAEQTVLAFLFSSSSEEKIRQISPALPDSMQGPALLSPPRRSSRPVQFLGTDAVLASELRRLWDAVVLTPDEEEAVAAIRIVEPDVERIAFLGEGRDARSILLTSAGTEQRLSLASAGSGLKRLLTLALYLSAARGGYLLVDEIDTGLHHSVMVEMWRLVIEIAKRLRVQVLATTHSLDCVRALAWAQEKNAELASEVVLHRVEPDLPSTVRYTMNELVIAAEHHLEVR
jgi:AAA domain, putative AbiEii toxin, Type IV TA system/AAA domain